MHLVQPATFPCFATTKGPSEWVAVCGFQSEDCYRIGNTLPQRGVRKAGLAETIIDVGPMASLDISD